MLGVSMQVSPLLFPLGILDTRCVYLSTVRGRKRPEGGQGVGVTLSWLHSTVLLVNNTYFHARLSSAFVRHMRAVDVLSWIRAGALLRLAQPRATDMAQGLWYVFIYRVTVIRFAVPTPRSPGAWSFESAIYLALSRASLVMRETC